MAAVNCNNGVVSGGRDGSRQECITSHAVGGRLKSYMYYISCCTVMEMLSNRGCNVPDSDLTFSVALSLIEFCTVFGHNPDLKCLCICVSLHSNPKKKISELLVNITTHVLQPKHEIDTAEEKKGLLRKHKLEDKKLPLMLETHAFARYYGLEKGQVVKITYRGGVAGALKTYRFNV